MFREAILTAFKGLVTDCDPSIEAATRPEFGDYQANFAMKLAKQLQKKPIDIANAVISELQSQKKIFKILEASGPGFINMTITNEFLAESLQPLANDDRLGIAEESFPQTVVVDYGSANVAKEMHVGHIRSLTMGDAIVRILGFLGHQVIRQNHLGDWGTQFGMLIEYLYEVGEHDHSHALSDLDALYKKSKKRFDEDSVFADKARARVVALQSGDETTLTIWKRLVKESLQYFHKIYEWLNLLLTEQDVRGESFYNPLLANTVAELEQKGLAEDSHGAVVIFLEGFLGPDKNPVPLIIRKKDGGYLYATTDLAAAKFRIKELGAKRLIYLTDARQKQHFAMLFATVRKAGWATDEVRLEHIPFGSILGKDGKPFKTRAGESIKLVALLEEAESKAMQIVSTKNRELTSSQLSQIAHDIGIGALKYADLRTDKVKDYIFDWDKLLSFEGNTAPYLQNAYVRIRAIFRKGVIERTEIKNSKILLETETEHKLAIKILDFPELIYSVAEDLSLHRLCDYLYELAATFHQFYENCPILSLKEKDRRDSRLLLADLTAQTLKLGLSLLGIKALEMM